MVEGVERMQRQRVKEPGERVGRGLTGVTEIVKGEEEVGPFWVVT